MTRRFAGGRLLDAFPSGEDLTLCFFEGGAIRVHSVRDDAELFRLNSPKEIPRAFFLGKGHVLALSFHSRPSQAYALPGGSAVADLSYKDYSLVNISGLPGSGLFLTVYREPLSGDVIGLIRNQHSLDPVAAIPGCCGILDGKRLLIAGNRNVKAVPWHTPAEIRAMAEQFTAGLSLTPEQRKQYHIIE